MPGEKLGVSQARGLQPLAVTAIDGAHLLGIARPRPLAGPGPQRLGEASGIDSRAAELGHETCGGAHEAGLRRRLGQQLELRPAHRPFDDELALDLRGHALGVPGPAGHLAEEPVEAQNARAEYRTALGQLTLSVLDVPEGGHNQDRLVFEAGPQPAQYFTRLGGVGGAGNEG